MTHLAILIAQQMFVRSPHCSDGLSCPSGVRELGVCMWREGLVTEGKRRELWLVKMHLVVGTQSVDVFAQFS